MPHSVLTNGALTFLLLYSFLLVTSTSTPMAWAAPSAHLATLSTISSRYSSSLLRTPKLHTALSGMMLLASPPSGMIPWITRLASLLASCLSMWVAT